MSTSKEEKDQLQAELYSRFDEERRTRTISLYPPVKSKDEVEQWYRDFMAFCLSKDPDVVFEISHSNSYGSIRAVFKKFESMYAYLNIPEKWFPTVETEERISSKKPDYSVVDSVLASITEPKS